MRILFLIRSLAVGGAERQLTVLANGLAARGHDIHVAVFYSGGTLEHDLAPGVTLHQLEKSGRWDLPGFVVRAIVLLRSLRPDVLHGYLPTANILAIFLARFVRGVRVVWGVRTSNIDLSRYDWLVSVESRCEVMLSRFAQRIIFNSHAGAIYAIRRGISAERIVVIPNGIDTARFRRLPALRKWQRNKWGIAEEEILIGIIGRSDMVKGHKLFLEAAKLLVENGSLECPVRFVCVGPGLSSAGDEIQAYAKSLGLESRIIWEESRSDVETVYNALDMLTSASIYGEGFPNVVAEAMACGVPCVVTDMGDSSLVVGDTGVVVMAEPANLADGWRKMLSNIAVERPGERASARINEWFSIEKLVMESERALVFSL